MDIPINLAIAVAWKLASQPSNALPVYNCTSGTINPVRWGDLETLGRDSIHKYPMENVMWYPGGSYKETEWVNRICQVFWVAVENTPSNLSRSQSISVFNKPKLRISNFQVCP